MYNNNNPKSSAKYIYIIAFKKKKKTNIQIRNVLLQMESNLNKKYDIGNIYEI